MEETFMELIFHGNIAEFSKIETHIQFNNFKQLKREMKKEWEIFMKYGGLSYTLQKIC